MDRCDERYGADEADLRCFVVAGHAHARELTSLLERLRRVRRSVAVSLDHLVAPDADPAFEALLRDTMATNRLATTVSSALGDRTAPPGPVPGRPSGVVGTGFGTAAGLLAAVRTVADSLDDLIVDAVPYAAAAPELSGRLVLGPQYPNAARLVNTHLTPAAVAALWTRIDAILVDRPGTGDPGGTFTTRPTGFRLAAPNGPPAEQGRRAIVGALADTADPDRLYHDEFQLVSHENGTYTVVLAGVTDLRNPRAGLDRAHRSVRDTDVVAVRSAASAAVDDNPYARMVIDALDRLDVPRGANLMIVGHSQGADTALDLAADEGFNGDRYHVTHVVAAGYHSEPQLAHVRPDTSVLVLQNNKDLPILFENLGHVALDPFEEFAPPPDHVIMREFDGGWRGAGHHQDNYTSYLLDRDDEELTAYFAAVVAAGYGAPGWAVAVDISHPGVG